MNNPFTKTHIEFHVLQSFPVTCLNRDDVGAPKSAMVGGTSRARVSSQCWKRQVRLALHDMGARIGIRTKRLAMLIADSCINKGANTEQAAICGTILGEMLAKDTLFFITPSEIDVLGEYAKKYDFELPVEQKGKKDKKGQDTDTEASPKIASLPKAEMTMLTKDLKKCKTAADGLDIALFGRMVAQAPELNMQAAAAFSHAISTHTVSNEVEFFTALDDLQTEPGSAHMGSMEYNSATYYRYISLDLGQLWTSLGGGDIHEEMGAAVSAFVKALYVAVPAARQSTQSGACPWDYARILVRRGQRMQMSCEKAVRSKNGYLAPSVEALNEFLQRQEQLSGSLFGKMADYTFGENLSFSLDALTAALVDFVTQQQNDKGNGE